MRGKIKALVTAGAMLAASLGALADSDLRIPEGQLNASTENPVKPVGQRSSSAAECARKDILACRRPALRGPSRVVWAAPPSELPLRSFRAPGYREERCAAVTLLDTCSATAAGVSPSPNVLPARGGRLVSGCRLPGGGSGSGQCGVALPGRPGAAMASCSSGRAVRAAGWKGITRLTSDASAGRCADCGRAQPRRRDSLLVTRKTPTGCRCSRIRSDARRRHRAGLMAAGAARTDTARPAPRPPDVDGRGRHPGHSSPSGWVTKSPALRGI